MSKTRTAGSGRRHSNGSRGKVLTSPADLSPPVRRHRGQTTRLSMRISDPQMGSATDGAYRSHREGWEHQRESDPLLSTITRQEETANGLLLELSTAMGIEQADRRVVVGYAAERLADLADEEGAEMIVVSSRGRGAFKSAFLGSVSTSLIGVARCPILVVPHDLSRTSREA